MKRFSLEIYLKSGNKIVTDVEEYKLREEIKIVIELMDNIDKITVLKGRVDGNVIRVKGDSIEYLILVESK